eukprot:525058-Amphidinium_carterae.1
MLPAALGRLQHLSELDLSHNDFLGSLPCDLFEMRHVGRLFLGATGVHGTLCGGIGGLSLLSALDLSYNRLSGSLLA